jgi:glycosyltransferase involved in cell wall biosynthesis
MITSDIAGTSKGKWKHTVEEGIEVYWLPVRYDNKMSYFERIKAFLKFAIMAGPKAATFKADIIFATSTPLTIIIPALWAKWSLKVPIVFEVRDLWPELPIAMKAIRNPVLKLGAKWLEKLAYKNSEHIVALSPGMKKGILKAGIADEKVTVIPNSSDVSLFTVKESAGISFRSQYDWLNNRPLVVYTGTLGHINGVGYLVELANEMAEIDPEVCFLIVGDGAEYQKVYKLAISRGVLNKNLFMLGSFPKTEVVKVLNAADIATSLFIDLEPMWANSANKFFDALASGTPVAINYGGWQKDMLESTGAGIYLDVNDYKKAAKDLFNFMNSKSHLSKAQAASRKLAVDRFNRDRLALDLLNILVKHTKNEEVV